MTKQLGLFGAEPKPKRAPRPDRMETEDECSARTVRDEMRVGDRRWRMSFAITKRQFLDGSKTQTRRLGWESLRVGDRFMGVEKAMGLKKGERQVEYGVRRVTRIRRERLDMITQADVIAEGFPEMTPAQFVELFCRVNKCEPSRVVTVIEFTPKNEEVSP